jgi:hypothetical protein
MRTQVLFPLIEGKVAYNVSGSFDLSDDERFAEAYVMGLPAGHKVVFERGFLFDSCDDVTWFVYKEPCCPDLELRTEPLFITMPGKFRAIVLRDNDTAPTASALSDLRIFINIIHDASGALRIRHNCCNIVSASVCDGIGSLASINPIGG